MRWVLIGYEHIQAVFLGGEDGYPRAMLQKRHLFMDIEFAFRSP